MSLADGSCRLCFFPFGAAGEISRRRYAAAAFGRAQPREALHPQAAAGSRAFPPSPAALAAGFAGERARDPGMAAGASGPRPAGLPAGSLPQQSCGRRGLPAALRPVALPCPPCPARRAPRTSADVFLSAGPAPRPRFPGSAPGLSGVSRPPLAHRRGIGPRASSPAGQARATGLWSRSPRTRPPVPPVQRVRRFRRAVARAPETRPPFPPVRFEGRGPHGRGSGDAGSPRGLHGRQQRRRARFPAERAPLPAPGLPGGRRAFRLRPPAMDGRAGSGFSASRAPGRQRRRRRLPPSASAP
jgi:hypothetical protein